MSNFVDLLEKNADRMQENVSVTENGAVGYKTTGEKLLDLNFMLSSMRNMDENEIWRRFLLAYNENPSLAIVWLFFARDREDGCGERRTFRVIFKRLCYENDSVAVKLLPLIPFYGRWDDLIDVFCGDVPCKVREAAFDVIYRQLDEDLDHARARKPISLLAKWMPSAVTSSKDTRRKAEQLRAKLGYTPKQYRKTFARLRKYLDVVEQKMSAKQWSEINYESVPSRASLNYRGAFMRNDGGRYREFLGNVKEGKAKINASVLFPYDIVHAYREKMDYKWGLEYDSTLEEQWKALPNKVPENGSTLVVVDGSGSMSSRIGNTGVSCHDVADSLGVYFSEKLFGEFRNSFITFSSKPQLIRFAEGLSLQARLEILSDHNDCSNTNIEKTFGVILDTAVRNNLRQEEIPANLLIVSDMEFDDATRHYSWEDDYEDVNESLFDTIRSDWERAGYKLPRLIFWNVCSRTGTIPVATNELGVALVSGFSPAIADMVLSGKLDPMECLLDKLETERYEPVRKALKE